MSHLSQASVLSWAILSTFLLGFLVWHLWKFDKFMSLGWRSNGTKQGTFKRLMTYSYLLSIPLLLFYAVTLTAVKYYSGYFITPDLHVIPLPYDKWSDSPKRWITSLYVAFSVSWALEMVSHLEELNFWLFLFALRAPQHWFRSRYFFTWLLGSIIALTGMPTVALLTKGDPVKSEAWIFFAGSIGSFLITVASLRVLWRFPGFIALIKSQGADPQTIVRLCTYSELNNVRVFFRFVFVVPLMILALDGIRSVPHHIVNENAYATDLLAITSGIGCIISSVLTILVFFPRSIATEYGYSTTATLTEDDFITTYGSLPVMMSPTHYPAPTPYTIQPHSDNYDKDHQYDQNPGLERNISGASSVSMYTYPKSSRTISLHRLASHKSHSRTMSTSSSESMEYLDPNRHPHLPMRYDVEPVYMMPVPTERRTVVPKTPTTTTPTAISTPHLVPPARALRAPIGPTTPTASSSFSVPPTPTDRSQRPNHRGGKPHEEGEEVEGPDQAFLLTALPYDTMQASGTRFSELSKAGTGYGEDGVPVQSRIGVRRSQSGKLHPYIRDFKSPLDLYNHMETNTSFRLRKSISRRARGEGWVGA